MGPLSLFRSSQCCVLDAVCSCGSALAFLLPLHVGSVQIGIPILLFAGFILLVLYLPWFRAFVLFLASVQRLLLSSRF